MLQVFAEFMVMVSGHDLESLSTLWHYINTQLALLIPGVTILSGWPGLPYGQLGQGPKPAALIALVEFGASDMKDLEALTDFCLWLRPGFSSPAVLEGGSLRPMMHALAATLIMYYEDSVNACEVLCVNDRMRQGMVQCELACSTSEADEKLNKWGTVLKTQFDVANLHLTSRAAASGQEQTVACLQQLSGLMSNFQRAVRSEMESLRKGQSTQIAELESLAGKINTLGSLLSTRAARSPAPLPKLSSPAQAATVIPSVVVPAPLAPHAPAAPWPTVQAATPSATQLKSHDTPAQAILHLRHFPGVVPLTTSLSGLKATTYYEMEVRGKARLSTSDVPRGKLVLDCFNAVATVEEKHKMHKNTCCSDIELSKIVGLLHDRFVRRLLQAWQLTGQVAPKFLANFKPLLVNSVSERLSEYAALDSTMTFPHARTKFTISLSTEQITELPSRSSPSKKRKVH